MDIFTLYVGQGSLAAVRAGNDAVIVDAHMPECDDITSEQIEKSLDHYLAKSNVRGLILTGLDRDHACPAGVESILTRYEPSWVMYPKVFKMSSQRSRGTKNVAPTRRDLSCATRCAWTAWSRET
jgi:beta-lactamase superfamily II metal-dependent hydrolase